MRGTTIEHLSLISSGPVKTFWYCIDCDAITSQPQCAYCATTIVTPLEDLMNRQSRDKTDFPNVLKGHMDGGGNVTY